MLLYFVVVIFAQQCGSAQAVPINKHRHAKHPSSSKPSQMYTCASWISLLIGRFNGSLNFGNLSVTQLPSGNPGLVPRNIAQLASESVRSWRLSTIMAAEYEPW
jgi:hypothetical protein